MTMSNHGIISIRSLILRCRLLLLTLSLTLFKTNVVSQQQYTLRGLEPFTKYTISLQVFNPAGDGPATTIQEMTDEGGMHHKN